MTQRSELARVVGRMKDFAEFRDYVKTLEVRRDVVIGRLIAENDPSKVEAIRGEARAMDQLINEIHTAIKDSTK